MIKVTFSVDFSTKRVLSSDYTQETVSGLDGVIAGIQVDSGYILLTCADCSQPFLAIRKTQNL